MASLEHDVRASRTRIRCPRGITGPPRLDDVRGRPRLGRDSRNRAGAAARVPPIEEPVEGSAIAVRGLSPCPWPLTPWAVAVWFVVVIALGVGTGVLVAPLAGLVGVGRRRPRRRLQRRVPARVLARAAVGAVWGWALVQT